MPWRDPDTSVSEGERKAWAIGFAQEPKPIRISYTTKRRWQFTSFSSFERAQNLLQDALQALLPTMPEGARMLPTKND
jgi:hypothetical protein